ncbi:hypothetical protein FKM82_025556 [Ascaphus truei]
MVTGSALCVPRLQRKSACLHSPTRTRRGEHLDTPGAWTSINLCWSQRLHYSDDRPLIPNTTVTTHLPAQCLHLPWPDVTVRVCSMGLGLPAPESVFHYW